MICILLVAGHASSLESEIKNQSTGQYQHLEGVPKALLPGVKGKRVLDYWWDMIKSRQLFAEVYLVTNADKYKYFERWATASEFPVENIVNDGTTEYSVRLGTVADLELCIRTKNITNEDVMVVAADMMCQDEKFDLVQLLNFYHNCRDGDLAIFYEMEASESVSSRGIVEVCPFTHRILKFLEKPKEEETTSRNASVVFYCLRPATLETMGRYLKEHNSKEQRNFGLFMQWLINVEGRTVYGMKLPTGFQLIGQTTLSEYQTWLDYFVNQNCIDRKPLKLTKRAYARIGVMGNPSDGFHGKTISLSIRNFWAEVTILESSKLVLTPHPLNDPTEFGSLADLHCISMKDGYLGGLRLLQATCKKFYHYCSTQGIALAKRNFTLKYDTNIPRQVGLAGSSAIVTATLKCLMSFFNLTEADIHKEIQPQFILEVEVGELNINAGLQDRVVQVYEGLVYMDFSREIMSSQGHGHYINISCSHFPKLFLAYIADPSDSGKIHSDVKQRWEAGDQEVVEGMRKFAEITDQSKIAIDIGDWEQLARLMNLNFDTRKSLYGEEVLGEQNLQMIEIGRKFGAGVKFPGSGGAVIGLLNQVDRFDEMKKEYQKYGFVFTTIIPNLL